MKPQISVFKVGEQLVEKMYNDETIDLLKNSLVEWMTDLDFAITSEPVPPRLANGIRRALENADPLKQGWSEMDVSENYRFALVEAPEGVDGFGTIAVEYRSEHCRLVAIEKMLWDWQTARYSSGLWPCNEVP
jgi:hypothetical protein